MALQHRWPCDEASGDLLDAQGSFDLTDVLGNVGADDGSRVYDASLSARHSGASRSTVQIGGDFTLFGRFKFTTLPTTFTLLSKWGGAANEYFLFGSSSGVIVWRIITSGGEKNAISNSGGSGSLTIATVSSGQWYYIAGGFDATAGNLMLYISQDATEAVRTKTITAGGGTPNASTGAFQVGARAGAVFLNGQADDIRVYDQLLSESELDDIVTGGSPPVSEDHVSTLSLLGVG